MLDLDLGIEDVPSLTNRIRELRKRRGLTLERLGAMIGAEHGTVSRLETGRMKLTADYLESLARALDCHPAELILDLADAAKDEREREALDLLRSMTPAAAAAWVEAGRHIGKR